MISKDTNVSRESGDLVDDNQAFSIQGEGVLTDVSSRFSTTNVGMTRRSSRGWAEGARTS